MFLVLLSQAVYQIETTKNGEANLFKIKVLLPGTFQKNMASVKCPVSHPIGQRAGLLFLLLIKLYLSQLSLALETLNSLDLNSCVKNEYPKCMYAYFLKCCTYIIEWNG